MELVTNESLPAEIVNEPVTTRTLTITVKVNNTSDIDPIVNNLKEFGEVAGVSYYEQTYNQENASDKGYIY